MSRQGEDSVRAFCLTQLGWTDAERHIAWLVNLSGALGVSADGFQSYKKRRPEAVNGAAVSFTDFVVCCVWFARFNDGSKRRERWSSYNLKHQAERASGWYVTNGALIMAAQAMGFDPARIEGTPNGSILLPSPTRGRRAGGHDERGVFAEMPVVVDSRDPLPPSAATKAAQPQRGSTMRTWVKLYKNGDAMAIQTNATDEGDFMAVLAETLSGLVDSGTHSGDWEFQFRFWLPQAVDICCKLRGYKAPSVTEQRVMIAGDRMPNEADLVASSVGEEHPSAVAVGV